MAADVEIANLALTKLGEKNTLLALTDDTDAGRTMSRLFPLVRDAELRRNRWKFAVKRDALTALATAPAWGYLYQYPLPTDFLAIIQVNDYFIRGYPGGKSMWAVEAGEAGRVLLTDLPPQLKFRYMAQVTNAGRLDPLFVESFACKLAYEACEALTQSASKKQALLVDYRSALVEAMRCDAIENPPEELPNGRWLDSREGPTYGVYDGAYPPA